jgi:hypothetical protein
LKGYAINQRINNLERKVNQHDEKFKLLIQSSALPQEGIFFDGQVFDARQFVSDIIRNAKHSIILIDNYIDDTTLSLFTKKTAKRKSCNLYFQIIRCPEARLRSFQGAIQ